MQKQIQQVQQYFKDKIIDEQFEVDLINDHTIDITIDEVYSFTVWTANHPENRHIYRGFMILEFTTIEKCEVEKVLRPIIEAQAKERAEAKIEELKKELAQLENSEQ